MGKCKICGKESPLISSFLGLCLECIRNRPEEALPLAKKAHALSRSRFGLVPEVPKGGGVKCKFCGNECEIHEGSKGYCGLVGNEKGKMLRDRELIATYYYDPHPTNCVAEWACPASGIGYPEYSMCKGIEYGYNNLAVFCIGCSFDCLFCQNWHFREDIAVKPKVDDEEFLDAISENTTCICFFGGDPTPQLDKITRICKKAEGKNRVLRFCLETDGNANPKLLGNFAEIGLRSGGNIKFDLKFWNEYLNIAITGVSNKNTYENFRRMERFYKQRKEIPFLTASTLMVPGYTDDKEVKGIASFIASIDEEIPYSLLAFYPHFDMRDLPLTKREDALRFQRIAKEEGLKNVRIGNVHLLA
ncbi:pyruvate formate lyase activating enzyme [Methanococcoides vulcani]|uniref:Pyruvate formate lyase activating enzyme n=1 Tax=Methanococcoides vulcani TaxID=1353158 RepID=A0A1H9Y096_9EURY|nr:radical SAM protein [Methanococcoides vulcani]SES62036.1 pyruvate formate lyase activating enzyme [Methanococcoides vulcani]